MIQAIVWALVFTSGAGMSRSGPMSTLISVVKRRVRPFELAHGEPLGIDADAALAAAVGDAHDGALPGHPHGQGTDLVEASRPGGSAGHPWRDRDPGCAGRGSPGRPRTLPSSMRTGTETMSSRSHSRSTARRPGSRSRRSAAMSNWRWAVAQGSMAEATSAAVIGRVPPGASAGPIGRCGRAGSRAHRSGASVHPRIRARRRAVRSPARRPTMKRNAVHPGAHVGPRHRTDEADVHGRWLEPDGRARPRRGRPRCPGSRCGAR